MNVYLTTVKGFISHMVQIILPKSFCIFKLLIKNFISHMVQIILPGYHDGTIDYETFISHMVQIILIIAL